MCLLILKPANVSIPAAHLINAYSANPHGCGVAYADGSKAVRIAKSAAWTGDDLAEACASLTTYPAIIHLRYATHGSLVDANTHPFELPRGWAAAHNGVISNVKCAPDESDTRAFLRNHVSPALEQGTTPLDLLPAIGEFVGRGNKLAFLAPDGQHGIANESSGHWKDGAWYSNDTYSAPRWSMFDQEEDEWPARSPSRKPDWYDSRSLLCNLCGDPIRGRFAAMERDIIACPRCIADPYTMAHFDL